jgi:hypothetical protein
VSISESLFFSTIAHIYIAHIFLDDHGKINKRQAKEQRTVARFKGAAKDEQRRVKRYVVRLIENLPIDPKTGKPKRGAIKAVMVVQQ